MFSTQEFGRIPLPYPIAAAGEGYWSFVRHTLQVPWFYVAYSDEADNDGMLVQMILLSGLEQLLRLTQDSAVKITEVNVVLPGYMVPARRWIMVPLAEVWRGHTPDEDHTREVYVAADGRRYSCHEGVTHEDLLDDKRLLFRSPAEFRG